MPEPIIKIRDIAWVRLQSPDLDVAERFLSDFGLVKVERTNRALYMRGTDPSHHIHITELGPARVLSTAFYADSEEDLERLAREGENASAVEDIDEPGGGRRVRLVDPNGMAIEVVHGLKSVEPLPSRQFAWNRGTGRERLGVWTRVTVGPAQVKRLGHAVFSTPEVEGSVAWARRHLGLVTSEDVHAEDDADLVLSSFNRVDRGEAFVDHHTVMFARHRQTGLNHIAFEVHDVDDVYAGGEWLARQGYNPLWGVGRHLLGSQIFDYWRDPWGRVHEHWTDTDVLNNQSPYRRLPQSLGLRSQWGPQAPQAFRDAASR